MILPSVPNPLFSQYKITGVASSCFSFRFVPTPVSVLFPVFQSMYSRVPECQITTYYYVGFAYLMMRRYQDAIRVFANILLYIQRTRNMFQRSTYKYEMVSSGSVSLMTWKVFVVVFKIKSPQIWDAV